MLDCNVKQEQFDFSLSFLALIICNLVYDSSVAALSSGKQQRNKDRVSANEKGARYSSEGFLGHDVVEVVHGDDLVVVGVGDCSRTCPSVLLFRLRWLSVPSLFICVLTSSPSPSSPPSSLFVVAVVVSVAVSLRKPASIEVFAWVYSYDNSNDFNEIVALVANIK